MAISMSDLSVFGNLDTDNGGADFSARTRGRHTTIFYTSSRRSALTAEPIQCGVPGGAEELERREAQQKDSIRRGG
jgi:hypothetical protein